MKVLAVDDDPIILELLVEVLKSVGHEDVTTALSAAAAFEEIDNARRAFDCILLDIQMPEMDGIELCQHLRAMPRYENSPILMITAMSDKGYIDRAFAAGATDYVTKPFDVMELSARLRVAETLVVERKKFAESIFAVRTLRERGTEVERPSLEDRILISDVDGCIGYTALTNYVLQLSRGSLFGSRVFSFGVCDIERLYEATTSFEFASAMTDTAEAIADNLRSSQFLVAYAGSGVFSCAVDSGQRLDTAELEANVRASLAEMELSYGDGRPMIFQVVVGSPFRLSLRSGRGAVSALASAEASVNEVRNNPNRSQNDSYGGKREYRFAQRAV